jgi:hypothetical protein
MFEPQLTISKIGVVKLGADIITPMLGTDDYWKFEIVNELQQRFPDHTIWLVGDLIHAITMRGTYRVDWHNSELLVRYFRMDCDNLEILATFLDRIPQGTFHMQTCAEDTHGDDLSPQAHECMSVGCAIGHGPAAGLQVAKSDREWWEYSTRVFGLSWMSNEWAWCFHGEWALIDNTPAGAAKRIRHLIRHGVPIDAEDQRKGWAHFVCV